MPKCARLNYEKLTDEENALLAHFGDQGALNYLWVKVIPQVERITGLFKRRYPWFDHDDLSQSVLCEFPKIVKRYNPARAQKKNIVLNKFLYFAFYRATQDTLRKDDPLGVKIPQKKRYPSFVRFSEITENSNLIETIVVDGYEKLDRGDAPLLDPDHPSEIHRKSERSWRYASYHDRVYHGPNIIHPSS